MVKINNYISTSQATPIVSTGGNSQLSSLLKGASQAAAQRANVELQELEQSKRMAAQKGALAAERKRQADLALPQSLANIQKAQLSTLGTFLAIDEQDRKVNEAKEARAYALNSSSKVSLGFIQAQEGIQQSIGADGSGLFDATKAWWDAKEKEIIENAPSEKAKLAALESFTANKTKVLGNATLTQGQMRKDFVSKSTQETIGVINNTARQEPNQYDNLREQWESIGSNLKEEGFSELQISERKELFERNLLWNKVNGLVDKGDALSIVELLGSEDNLKILGENYSDKAHATTLKMVGQQRKLADSQQMESEYVAQFLDNTLNLSTAESKKVATKASINFLTQAEQSLMREGSNPNAFAKLTKEFFNDKAKYITKDVKGFITSKMFNSDNPQVVAAYSQMIGSMSSDVKTAQHMDKISSKDRDLAYIVNDLMVAGKDPAEAVKQARELVLKVNVDPNRSKELDLQWSSMFDPGFIDGNLKNEIDDVEPIDFVEDLLSTSLFFDDFDNISRENAFTIKHKYKNLLKQKFHLTNGNIELATKQAKAEMSAAFGLSKVNGKDEVVFMPPEKVFIGDTQIKYFNQVKDSFVERLREQGITNNVGVRSVPLENRNLTNGKYVYTLYDMDTGDTIMYKDESGETTSASFAIGTDTAAKIERKILNKKLDARRNKEDSAYEAWARGNRQAIVDLLAYPFVGDRLAATSEEILEAMNEE